MTQTLEIKITATWRKTKSGEWVAFGNAADLKAALDNDLSVTMVRKDGTEQTRVLAKVGRSFDVDGVEMCYGYLMPEMTSAQMAFAGYQAPAAAEKNPTKGYCEECGRWDRRRVQAYDLSGISGMVCRPCKADEGHLSFA